MTNIGATCYLNSIVQALVHILPFRVYFTDKLLVALEAKGVDLSDEMPRVRPIFRRRDTLECMRSLSDQSLLPNGKRDRPFPDIEIYLCIELHKVFRVLWSAQWSSARPYGLLRALWKLAPQFATSQQQDASEFFSIVCDRLHGELMTLLSPATGSIISSCFEGRLKTTIVCPQCGRQSNTFNVFLELTLSVPDGANGEPLFETTLAECLRLFAKEESVEYRCDGCGTLGMCSKQVCISQLPKVLVVCIKRFTFSRLGRPFKVKSTVAFPLREAPGLDLAQFCDSPPPPCTTFHLRSIVSHHGRGIDRGHYTTTSFNDQRGLWILFDDHKVTHLSPLHSPSHIGSPYLLFYERADEFGIPTTKSERITSI